MTDLAAMRQEYETAGLDRADLDDDPVTQFERWLDDAVRVGLPEPNAMVLSTVDEAGQPWSRYVLLKGVGPDGFDFYSNERSNKGRHLAGHAHAAATVGWLGLHRQVNLAGPVVRVPDDAADAYWASRPRGARVAATASNQSHPLADRDELMAVVAEIDGSADDHLPRPGHWGGWRIVPHTIEFWQGRPNRLHDRLRYVQGEDGWTIRRLAP
ncbi:MAG: pyridoxamine 5'-phosphate oxidase [Acidimicrobiales bacterium]